MQLFSGRDYLKIDIANNYGLDKKTWNDRISWFNENQDKLHSLVQTADEPALYYAGVKAWEDVQAGNPIGYMVSLDATSSGLQLLAALTGDRKAAGLCNVVNTYKDKAAQKEAFEEVLRQDAYTGIYNEMLEVIGESSKITRDDTKQAIDNHCGL